ncbi:Uncharacterised protein [Mycobacteroides abscessus subsp. abscessus]|nr:Uncharacterised protein [Mycobacteroides abscessus subsp. abscessus]
MLVIAGALQNLSLGQPLDRLVNAITQHRLVAVDVVGDVGEKFVNIVAADQYMFVVRGPRDLGQMQCHNRRVGAQRFPAQHPGAVHAGVLQRSWFGVGNLEIVEHPQPQVQFGQARGQHLAMLDHRRPQFGLTVLTQVTPGHQVLQRPAGLVRKLTGVAVESRPLGRSRCRGIGFDTRQVVEIDVPQGGS